MSKRSRSYPHLQVDTTDSPAVGQAGAVLLTETVRVSGLDAAISTALTPWRKPLAVHDPGKVLLDLALSLAVGGDCLADIACGPSRVCSGRWPRTPRCCGRSTCWPVT